MMIPDAVKIKELADVHIRRYQNMLDNGSPCGMVRRGETTHYLRLWQSIEAKGYDWDRLTQSQRSEIREALMDEEP